MGVTAELLINQPWIVLAICYGCLLLGVLSITMVGSLVSAAVGQTRTDNFGLFSRMLIGLTTSTVIYALVRSGFQTSLIPIIIFAVGLWRAAKHSTHATLNVRSKWITRKQVYLLLASATTVFLLFATLLINFKTGDLRFLGAGESAQYIDFPFTVRAGQCLNFSGIEAKSTNFFDASVLHQKPYHWLEIWFAALIYKIIPINAEVLWSCVVNPMIFTTLLIGINGLIERIVGDRSWLFLGSLLILFISGFGILYPSNIEFFSATVRAESILETPKYAIAYLFALPVAEALYSKRHRALPYLFILFGLSYLPIMPVASMMAFASVVLNLWAEREDRKRALMSFAIWCLAYVLMAGWFYVFYSQSQISYTEGAGASTGLLKTLDPVLSIKVFVHMLIQIFLTNVPFLLILGAILIGQKKSELISVAKDHGRSLLLLLFFYPVSILGYVMIYGMTNSVQVWTVSYQSLHYTILVCLMVFALNHSKTTVKALSMVVIAASVFLNFHVDLGAGNERSRDELTSINEFIVQYADDNPQFVYLGDARYGNDGAGGLFDLVTDIFYPCRELGILVSPYANASITLFEIPLSNNQEQRTKQQIILAEGPFYQFVAKQTSPNELTSEQVAKFKVDFLSEYNVDFVIVPFDQELSEELIPLVGEFIEVRDGKIYQVR